MWYQCYTEYLLQEAYSNNVLIWSLQVSLKVQVTTIYLDLAIIQKTNDKIHNKNERWFQKDQFITQKVDYIQIENDSLAKLTLIYNVKKILYDNSIRSSSAHHQILEENMILAVDRDTQSWDMNEEQ